MAWRTWGASSLEPSSLVNTGPPRFEQRGSALTDAKRRERLQPYANELINFLRRQGRPVTTPFASKHLREQPRFGAAIGLVQEGVYAKGSHGS